MKLRPGAGTRSSWATRRDWRNLPSTALSFFKSVRPLMTLAEHYDSRKGGSTARVQSRVRRLSAFVGVAAGLSPLAETTYAGAMLVSDDSARRR